MGTLSYSTGRERALISSKLQPCIKAIRSAQIHPVLREELEAFIARNTLSDCNMVPPNCLKAHMIKKAKELNLRKTTIGRLKKLFRSRIGYKGYYVDAGELKKI